MHAAILWYFILIYFNFTDCVIGDTLGSSDGDAEETPGVDDTACDMDGALLSENDKIDLQLVSSPFVAKKSKNGKYGICISCTIFNLYILWLFY